LILGKLVPIQTLGIYGIAFTLSDLPRQIMIIFSARIGLPFLAKFAQLPRTEFRAMFLRYRGPVLVVMAFVLAVLINVSDLVFTKIYDNRYHGGAWMVPLLGLGLWHTLLYTTSSPGLMAIGKLNYSAGGYLSTFLALIIFLPLAYAIGGIRPAVAVVAFSDLPYYLITLYGQMREGMQSIEQDLRTTLAFLFFLGGGFLIRMALGAPTLFPFLAHTSR
jgi:O-antigen/teichoic acid export membrane protein